jgi:hypothetical protein
VVETNVGSSRFKGDCYFYQCPAQTRLSNLNGVGPTFACLADASSFDADAYADLCVIQTAVPDCGLPTNQANSFLSLPGDLGDSEETWVLARVMKRDDDRRYS